MTAEGEGPENKEDLFEDLDKFFAPIQDVDWPEPVGGEGEPAPRAPSEPAPPSPPERAGDLPEAKRESAPEPAGAEPALGEPAGQGGLFSEAGERATEPVAEGDGQDAAAYATEEYSVEDFGRAPPEYVDLAEAEAEEGAEEEEEPAAAPLFEGPGASEAAPSPEAIEAAAEHFAVAIREEEEAEPERETAGGPAEPGGVEEAILAELEEPAVPARTVKVGAEGLGGPSWQEPTSMEVGADRERRPTERDVPAAFLTGLGLTALAVGSIAIGAGAFAIVAGAVVLWAQGELYRAMQKRHHQPATALGLVSGALVLAAGYYRGEPAMLAVVALSVFATFLWYMAASAAHRKHTLVNVGLTVLGVIYVPLLAAYALATLKLPDGRGLTLSIIGLTFAYDTAAFVLGYFWGSRPLAPTVSPKKSWEGAVAATLVVIAVSVGVVGTSIASMKPVPRTLGLGVVVAIFATVGDLAESLLKRDLGVKDMGSILPGHGGVLDRIDSVLFVAPAAFLFLRLILAH